MSCTIGQSHNNTKVKAVGYLNAETMNCVTMALAPTAVGNIPGFP